MIIFQYKKNKKKRIFNDPSIWRPRLAQRWRHPATGVNYVHFILVFHYLAFAFGHSLILHYITLFHIIHMTLRRSNLPCDWLSTKQCSTWEVKSAAWPFLFKHFIVLINLGPYLIFVISFTQAGFLKTKFYTQKNKRYQRR